jgi:hypothetical protein
VSKASFSPFGNSNNSTIPASDPMGVMTFERGGREFLATWAENAAPTAGAALTASSQPPFR